ncbi:MAG: tyrosine-type recombinase/integrase [Actinomycetota bacterium]|nr:tyrosine-type recombinase/integrase [Actinomycetota bacterium]
MAYVRRRSTTAGPRFDVCWRENGRERSRTFTFRKDADRFRIEVERRSQLGALFEAAPVALGEWWEGYLHRWSIGKAAGTVRRRKEAWKTLSVLHDLPLRDITRAVAEDAIVAIARRAPRQAQLALALVKAMLRDAQQRGHRIDVAVLTLAPASYDEREPVYLTIEHLEALASWSTEPRLILFAGLSGLRQGECFALRDSDVHLDEGDILVSRGAYEGQPTRTKSRKRRRVYLCAEAVQVLREQLLARRPGASLVFPAPVGGIWRSENFMERVFRKAAIRARLGERDQDGHYSGVTFHDLRHTFASLMIAAGANPLQIAETLGHTDRNGQPDATLVWRRYGHLYPGSTKQAADALGGYMTTERQRVRDLGGIQKSL